MLARFPRLQLLVPLLLVLFATLALLRVGFYSYFLAGDLEQPAATVLEAFGIGLRFDFRLALLMVLPLAILSLLPGWFGLRGTLGPRLGLLLSAIAMWIVASFYVIDFGHFSYLGERINVSVLNFLEDGMDTWQMLWESYPVVWLALLLILVTAAFTWFVNRLIQRYRQTEPRRVRWHFAAAALLVVPGFVFGVMGKVGSTVPLRWSDAYFSGNPDVAALALNPVVFFADTLANRSPPYQKALLREHYPAVAEYLGVDEPAMKPYNFVRQVAGEARKGRLPNVVFIHLESLGANRSGLYGNPMEATPNIDAIAQEGIFFPNFMVPASGTARTVFGLITGIPDVTWGGTTATRNPLISDQYTLVNAFQDYKRLYFIGGSAGWANIKGLLQHSIDDLELWEEGSYDAPAVDVWGISDRSLFTAAHKRLQELPDEQPFVAFIQLAGNHRPFTIPEEESDFVWRDRDATELNKYGFLAVDQYNAVRLLDYNVGYYLRQLVPAGDYANNTIFLLYGDHNDRSEPSVHMGYSEKLFLDKHHVPFIIYAPGLIDEPRVIEDAASLVDLLPTALGFTGLPYENRTLGRDLLAWSKRGHVLTFGGDRTNRPSLGLLDRDYLLSMYHDGADARLYPLVDPHSENDVSAAQPEEAQKRMALLHGIYQSARYLLHHNSKH